MKIRTCRGWQWRSYPSWLLRWVTKDCGFRFIFDDLVTVLSLVICLHSLRMTSVFLFQLSTEQTAQLGAELYIVKVNIKLHTSLRLGCRVRHILYSHIRLGCNVTGLDECSISCTWTWSDHKAVFCFFSLCSVSNQEDDWSAYYGLSLMESWDVKLAFKITLRISI